MTSELEPFFKKAALRRQVALLGDRVLQCSLALGGVAIGVVLCGRLLGIGPRTLPYEAWYLIPAFAFLLGLLMQRKAPIERVAQDIDSRSGSKELFATAASMATNAGNFSSLVISRASERAAQTNLSAIFPFQWGRPFARVLFAALVLVALQYWLPQLDPFKQREKQAQTERAREQLATTIKTTELRKAELAQPKPAEDMNQALAKLAQDFKATQPGEKKLNEQKLANQSQKFGKIWKDLAKALPAPTSDAAQKFGSANRSNTLSKHVEALKKGDASGLQKELSKLQEQMKQLAAEPDSAAKKEKMEQLSRELASMVNDLKDQVGSRELNDALARAMAQMDMSRFNNMGKDALDASNQSLELSKEELQRLAEQFNDMQAAEDALKNLQMAKSLNQMGQLDGSKCKGSSMSDYARMYADMLAKCQGGQGQGDGDGQNPGNGKSGPNPGIGNGGSVGEDDTTKTNFDPTRTPTQITAGKMLMEWKEKGMGETGDKGTYTEAVRSLKQSADEAIRSEKIPPGYHSTIQKYFDSLPEQAPEKVQ